MQASRVLLSGAIARPRLEGKVAVITGAGAGIGRETALKFVREGAKGIVLADMNEAGLHEPLTEIEKIGGKGVAIKTNVTQSDDCKRMVELAEQKFGHLNILFNNAGIMHMDDDNAMTTTEAVFDIT